jgi:Zn-finger nucleic acid-binding protein
MNCPSCNAELRMTDRQGIEIDYCPKCRGVWLDRGELDKIIERSGSADARRYEQDRSDSYDDDRKYRKSEDKYAGGYDSHGRGHRKRKSFLDDIFDF